MIRRLSECITINLETPQVLLSLTSTLMKAYPAFLKASLLLNRFVQ